ncbi:MAG TPA: TadE/TadG family type IV pilus assembly protein [Acidothermaceae bacterium]|nr:TadE/TadG family type IV pilus assembly protein [Acidothermaceae bacterium]
MSSRARPDDSRRDAGAAALEFALVLPVLVLILFGIIDYGLYFSNTLNAESGVQTAARQAIVGNLDATCTTPTDAPAVSTQVGELMCMVKNNTGSITGTSYVKVVFPAAPPNGTNPAGWYPGQQLIVCEVIDVQGLTGYVPLPRHDGQVAIRSKVVTQLETVALANQQADPGGEEDSPPGGWDWCT